MHEYITSEPATVWIKLVDQFYSTPKFPCRHNARGALEVLPSTLLTEVLREVAVGYDRWVVDWLVGQDCGDEGDIYTYIYIYHGNLQPSFLGVITHIWGA